MVVSHAVRLSVIERWKQYRTVQWAVSSRGLALGVASGPPAAARRYEAMLDQVEVTVAEQPLPRLQAAGSAQAVFPFLYELSWAPRESFSPARLRRHGLRRPPSTWFPARAMSCSGSAR